MFFLGLFEVVLLAGIFAGRKPETPAFKIAATTALGIGLWLGFIAMRLARRRRRRSEGANRTGGLATAMSAGVAGMLLGGWAFRRHVGASVGIPIVQLIVGFSLAVVTLAWIETRTNR
jgi:phosphatidylglycerophosphate synthase